MPQKKQLSISEFSKLTGIKRENLRFYDRIGLLSPEARGDNRYRYYSRRQLSSAYLISSLRGLGVGIEAIKEYERTPEKSLALLASQDELIRMEIERLNETREIMRMYSEMTREAISRGNNALFLQEKEEETLFLCPPVPKGMSGDEGGVFSYEYAGAMGVNPGFPQGTIIPRENVKMDNTRVNGRYYFKVVRNGNACKPKGLYAVAYGIADPWESAPIYRRLVCFIKEQSMSICGDAFEEYPLGDLAANDLSGYCIRIEIPVTRDK